MNIRKVVIAADSFKGSLSSGEVARSVERGVREVFPCCEIVGLHVADGGEGTVEALHATMGGELISARVADPLMRIVEARYLITDSGRTAVVELASASGLTRLGDSERNPMETTTYGTGQLIADALSRGCRNFLVTLGGSATNDAGTGLLQALGFRFFDASGAELGQGGKMLGRIARIDDTALAAGVRESAFTVACDVRNPFSGRDGAAYIFAPQKGADPRMVEALDHGLKNFAEVVAGHNGAGIDLIQGAGAAGGAAGGLVALLGAELVSGIDMVLCAAGFEAMLDGADLVITGEGRLDSQTAMGKAPRGVLDAAAHHRVPVIAIGGAVEESAALNRQGFAAVFPILSGPATLEEAMHSGTAGGNITRTVEQIMRVLALKK